MRNEQRSSHAEQVAHQARDVAEESISRGK